MTNKDIAKKELKRIERSFRYREKKYGIQFPKGTDIAKSILGREAKTFTKYDIRKLQDIKGSELYRFGTYQDYTGETITGFKTENIVKQRKKAVKEARRISYEQFDKNIEESVKDIRNQESSKINITDELLKDKSKRSKSYSDELTESTDQLISNFNNYTSWVHDSDKLREKILDYSLRAVSEFGRRKFAYVIESCMSSGDLVTLKQEAYWWNFETKIAEYLEPHFGYLSDLEDIEEEMLNNDTFNQSDYDESDNPYE